MDAADKKHILEQLKAARDIISPILMSDEEEDWYYTLTEAHDELEDAIESLRRLEP